VLERAGFAVELPRKQVCCGRPMISKGLLEEVKPYHRSLIDTLLPQVEDGTAIVGLEPSCILTLRDELPDLTRDPRARILAERSFTLEEFLAAQPDWRPGRLERRATVHGHCHQKALVGMKPTEQVLKSGRGAGVPDPGFRLLRDGGLVRLREGSLRRLPRGGRARPLPGHP
jgi:Fe-S oxidoreductase